MDSNAQPRTGGRSLIAAGAKIVGDLDFPGLVEVLGRIDGNLSAGSILIGEGGSVNGSLVAGTITLRGSVSGKVIGDAVVIHSSAEVTAEIGYGTLTVESGAGIEGQIRRRDAAPAALEGPGTEAEAG